MGREYRTRLKEQYGRDAVAAFATVEMGASLGTGAGTTSAADAFSNSGYSVARAAKLDLVHVQLSDPLGSGETITVNILIDGSPVGTVDLVESDTHGDRAFLTELEQEVRIPKDSTLTLTVTKSTTSGSPTLTARAHLRLFEK